MIGFKNFLIIPMFMTLDFSYYAFSRQYWVSPKVKHVFILQFAYLKQMHAAATVIQRGYRSMRARRMANTPIR